MKRDEWLKALDERMDAPGSRGYWDEEDKLRKQLDILVDALTDDELVINVAKDFAPGEHFCSSDAQHCVSRGAAIIGFKNAIIGRVKEPV